MIYRACLIVVNPNLFTIQVGTLDLLVGLSEDLGKLDSFVEQVMKKVSNYLGDVLEDQRDKLSENLLANGGEPARRLRGEAGRRRSRSQ